MIIGDQVLRSSSHERRVDPLKALTPLKHTEQGARWAVLRELGRIGELSAFEEAVEWALENRPVPNEARAYIRRFRLRRHRLTGARG
jgi:hypothetical protein